MHTGIELKPRSPSRAAKLAALVYSLIGTQLEEKDVVALFGDKYRRYQKNVGMLLPTLRRNSSPED